MEIVERPWGTFELLKTTKDYWVKILTIKKGHRISMQSHHDRKEFWTVISGEGEAEIESYIDIDIYSLIKGSHLVIPAEAKHRITNTCDKDLVVCELALGRPNEADIKRYEDDYGRT